MQKSFLGWLLFFPAALRSSGWGLGYWIKGIRSLFSLSPSWSSSSSPASLVSVLSLAICNATADLWEGSAAWPPPSSSNWWSHLTGLLEGPGATVACFLGRQCSISCLGLGTTRSSLWAKDFRASNRNLGDDSFKPSLPSQWAMASTLPRGAPYTDLSRPTLHHLFVFPSPRGKALLRFRNKPNERRETPRQGFSSHLARCASQLLLW